MAIMRDLRCLPTQSIYPLRPTPLKGRLKCPVGEIEDRRYRRVQWSGIGNASTQVWKFLKSR
jgi:hypothetical protein